MAYTVTLSAADPASSEPARLGAQRLRELEQALIERLNSVFNDANTDPLTLRADIVSTTQLQVDAVATENILNGAVTTPKIADGQVTAAKVALGSLEITHLTPAARSSLVKQTVYRALYGSLSPPINPGANYVGLVFTGGLGQKTLVAWWSTLATADFTTDPIALATTLQPFADSTKLGVIIRNHTGAVLNPTGYEISVAVLEEP